MFITGTGTATPPKRYRQQECWDALQNSPQLPLLQGRSRAILKKVLLGANGIATRHLALDPLEEAFTAEPDRLHERFSRHAPALAAQAAQQALQQSGDSATSVDAVIISTCTGYLCPGLTSYVSERLGLRPDVLCLDLVGQGCGAAIPNLRAGEALLKGGGASVVLSICVEVCSAAFYLDDDPGVLISACLFGDGAGAAVLRSTPTGGGRTVAWKHSTSITKPADRDLLRFEQKNGMLRNILSPAVPTLAAQHAKEVLDRVLSSTGHSQSDITTWILHAGGRDVLAAVGERLELAPEDICWSARLLRDYGNLSSPFVLFVLHQALQERAPGGLWWMAAFGAGFSSHGALLEVT